MLRIADGIAIEDREVEERFVRAMGADGQNPRRSATAVELRLDVNASSLPPEIRQRLRQVGGRRVTRDGVLVVVSRKYRSQLRNRQAARQMLAALVKEAAEAAASEE